MHLPEIDKYAHLDSAVHRWDARVRIASLLALLLAVVLAPTYPRALTGLAAAIVLLLASRIPILFVLVHVRWVLAFCAFLLIVMSLTAGGPAACSVGPVDLSREGLRLSGLISVRALAAVLLIFPMLGTSPFHVSLRAMRRLRMPRVAVQILSFSYRYVFVLFDELHTMVSAARARGFRRARPVRRLGIAGNMLGMLMIRSLDRTSKVHRAMLARGYTGEIRTLDEFHVRPADIAKGAAVLGLAAAIALVGVLM